MAFGGSYQINHAEEFFVALLPPSGLITEVHFLEASTGMIPKAPLSPFFFVCVCVYITFFLYPIQEASHIGASEVFLALKEIELAGFGSGIIVGWEGLLCV